MSKHFEMKDLLSGVNIVHYENSQCIELSTYRGGEEVIISLYKDDLLKIFLKSCEEGFINSREAYISLQHM